MANRAIFRGILLVLEVVFLAGCARPATPPPGHTGLNLFYARRFNPAADGAVLDSLRKITGFHWLREEVSLSEVAPRPDVRDFKKYDDAFRALRAHDFYPVILISDPPPWVRSDLENQLPALTFEVVKRYYRCCSQHYQILNEVNTARFWGGPPDPAAYARVLRKVHDAVKREYPEATLLAAGLATPDVAYLKDFAAAGGLEGADVLAVHPYTYPAPYVGWDAQQLLDFQAIAPTKPLWVTEIGWPTSSVADGVSEAQQGAYLIDSVMALRTSGVDMVFWYDYRDDGTDPGSLEANFGLVHHDNSPKKAFQRFAQYISRARGFGFRRVIRTIEPVPPLFAEGFNFRYHADQLKDGHSILFDTPAELKGWSDLDHACLQMNVESTEDDPKKPGARPDGILLGYEIQDKNKKKIDGIFGRVYWIGEKQMAAPVRLRETPNSPPLVPPFTLTGLVLQASNMYKGEGLPEGVITVSDMSTCEFPMPPY